MKIKSMNHISINVSDFDAAKAFFLDLGLEVVGDGEWESEGKWLDQVMGLEGIKTKAIMLQTPDGQGIIEVVKYYSPSPITESEKPQANTLGFVHIAFEVDDVEAIVHHLKQKGGEMVGTLMNYQDVYKLCYVRGPEGIILELAEKLN